MSSNKYDFSPFLRRMQAEGLPSIAVETFAYYYAQLRAGQTGLISEHEIEPVVTLPDAETLSDEFVQAGQDSLSKTAVLKLNGGLGTGMGLNKAKTLLTVKSGLSFLDIIARQALHSRVPLILMNSFNTQADTLAALQSYPTLSGKLPLDFLQHKVPKVAQKDGSPATYPHNPALEWAPPGHGDIYTALITSGLLDHLLTGGYEYAFVSNADNLGAVLDTKILGYFVDQQFSFMMEAADRTEVDKKGGHLARRPDGQLILRESAQVADTDKASFQDISRHRYFNTNNLWLNLPQLKQVMAAQDNILGLPMIRNSKTVNPRDSESTAVYQIETAMGSAIAVFAGSGAIRVPRSRFAPIKTTSDLLAVRSDAYCLTDDFRVVIHPDRMQGPPTITLDSAYYKRIDDMEARFAFGTPSLIDCQSLTISGDVVFGKNVTLRGAVNLINDSEFPLVLDDNSVIDGD